MKKTFLSYFTKTEILLWFSSLLFILLSFFIFDGNSYLTLIASLIGATSLIFSAKGNSVGQILMIIFSIFYGAISYGFAYYGEMITYLGMTLPMSVIALISWLKNPFKGKKSEVKINRISKKEFIFSLLLTAFVTLLFYFILAAFHTTNLFFSTLSVATSFLAVYLTFRRSAYFALAYAANDVVLIVLWTLAVQSNLSYVSVLVCFIVFLINDLYGFLNWCKTQKKQEM